MGLALMHRHAFTEETPMRLKIVPALVALACTPPALLAQVTDSMILDDARSVGDVLSWGLGTEGQRYSPLRQVNTATVSRLVPAWAFWAIHCAPMTARVLPSRGSEASAAPEALRSLRVLR